MEALIVLVLTFGLLWVLFILPQQRRVRAHQRLVMSLQEGDEVILSAGIFGRITQLGPEELTMEVAPGVELRVARQAVLRRVEYALDDSVDDAPEDSLDEEVDEAVDVEETAAEASPGDAARIDSDVVADNNADRPDGDRTTS
jgi:preprotein translocase subunit YajC